MTKEEVIAFLTEQRDLRLIGYEWVEGVTSGDNTRNN